MQGLMGAESVLTGTMGRLFAVMEAYPDLKANQNMLSLQEELTTTENKIGFARQFYNDQVMTYNTSCEMFPNSIIAGTFNFEKEEFFEIEEPEERVTPKVEF
jgi:LemA protein